MKKLTDYAKIMQVLEAKGIKSVSKAEKMAGLGASTIQKLKNRPDGGLHEDNLKKFLRTFHVNQRWWETGEQEMFIMDSGSALTERIKTMDMDVWEVIKGSNKIFELEFNRLWALIDRIVPSSSQSNHNHEKPTNAE